MAKLHTTNHNIKQLKYISNKLYLFHNINHYETMTYNNITLDKLARIEIHYSFLRDEEIKKLSQELKQIEWQQNHIKIFGKKIPEPRLTYLMTNEGVCYNYSNSILKPKPWQTESEQLKNKLYQKFNLKFNSALFNKYKNGEQYMGWHQDNEKSLGTNPIIASYSLGATRRFLFRNIIDKSIKKEVILEHNSLLIMKGDIQHRWQHALPKSKKVINERINITFRKVI